MVGQIEFVDLSDLNEMTRFHSLICQEYPDISLELYQARLAEMIPKSYYQVVLIENEKPIAIAGYWLVTRIWSGKYIDVDNVVVDKKNRSRGLGAKLMSYIEEIGKREGCEMAVLDAYIENWPAHKFYYREGYVQRGYHYTKKL